MENLVIKERLQEYINSGDEKLLNLMYVAAKEYTKAEEEYNLTEEEIAELDRRRKKRESGDSKGYSWSDAKKIITNN